MSSGDIATWFGAIGTWLVGIAAGLIALLQYNHGRFNPQVIAYQDSFNRIAVRITNRGAGSGTVEDVDLLKGGHGPDTPSVFYKWEISSQLATEPAPIPFTLVLAGRAGSRRCAAGGTAGSRMRSGITCR